MKKSTNCLPKPCIYFFQILLFLLCGFSLQAQIEIAPGNQNPWNPQNLIENVFLGEGVVVTDITYSGADGAVGYFQNGDADIGIDRGIIMTSGFAIDGLGPNNSGSSGEDNNSNASCPELAALANNIQNISAYEITFIPVNDTLRFRYGFASEEYPEFACTGFNDVFGFFISGPNPSGGNYLSENIALVPDPADPTGLTFTPNPVTINNVNGNGINVGGGCNFDFGTYYNTNNGNNLQYDGYLDVFTAQVIVTPCEPYTIKLAVADAGDPNYDTAVFLEAKSFGTGALEVTAQTVSLDGTLVEGCSNGELCFELPSPAEADQFLDYNFIGTAINGVDFETIPLDLFIAAGDSVVCYPIIPIEDGIMEGTDSLGIDVQVDPCTRDTFWITIKDPALPDAMLPNDTTICNGDSLYIDGTIDITLPPPPTFTNNTTYPIQPPAANDPTLAEINVAGVFPLTLQPNVIKSVCIDSLTHTWDDDLEIFLFAPGGEFIELSTRNGANGNNYINTCFTPTSTNEINIGPNNQAPSSATPFTGEFTPEGDFADLYGTDNPTNGTWTLFVYDRASLNIDGALHSWTICFEPLYQLEYNWSPAAGLSCTDCPDPWAQPDVTTTYTLTVTDTYGCSTQDSITITVEDILPAPTVTCGLITSNSITFEWNDVMGASSGYQVNVGGQGWIPANGILQHTVTGLSLNQTVTIEVQAIGDCDGEIGTVTCMTPDCPAPTGQVTNIIDNVCFGDSTGTASISGMGANPPFVYSMNGTIDADGIFTNLAAGDYQVLIVDDVSCSVTVDFTIGQTDSLASVEVLMEDISCNGFSDGEGTVTVTGGTAPYGYMWSTGSTDSIATNLVLGQNYVVITDANGCSIVDSVEVTQPDILTANIAADVIDCFGGMDGNATVVVNGGTPDYTFLWSDAQNDMIANNLSATTYTVTVTDMNGCTVEESVTVLENDALDLTNISSTLAACNGAQNGTATINPTGGAGGYSYLWSFGAQSGPTAFGLQAGTYTVTVTDQLGCMDSTNVIVSSPNTITAGFNSMPTSCFDSSDGQVIITASGGTPDPNLPNGYTFMWSEMGGIDNAHNSLPAGTHFVTITDANQCSEILEVEVFSPTEITTMLNANTVNCANGTDGEAAVIADGGAGGYMYTWSAGAFPNNPNVTGLSAGLVYVTVEDANGCTKVDSIEVTAPNAIVLTSDSTGVDCFGNDNGTATVIASSGAGNFSYLWDDAMNQTTPVAVGLVAGTYNVVVTDANMCTETIAVEVIEPDILTTSIGGNDAVCFGESNGNATVTPSGGTSDYTYQWSDSNNQTTAMANGLAAQTTPYYVTVTDMNGCSTIDSILINSPTELTLTLDGVDLLCFGENTGTATANAGGSAGNFTYAWSDPNNQTNMMASTLTAGTYTVTVTDANLCTIEESIELIQPDELIIFDDNITDVDCNGNTTGAINLDVQGGTGAYTYLWSNAAVTQDLATIGAGTFTLTVTDANFCETIQAYTIVEPSSLDLSFTNENVDCFMGNDGSIELTVFGGAIGAYDLMWTGPNGFSSTQEDLSDLTAGDYTIVATDINGCSISETINISQPSMGVTTSISPPVTICFGTTEGTATVTANGGTPPYNYLWNDPNSQNTATATNLPSGTFTVTVTDQSGCTFTESALVNEQPEITILLSQTSALCNNAANGTATVDNILYGGNPATISDFEIQWSGGQTSTTANNIQGGSTVDVVVTDVLGCTATASIQIDNPAAVGANIVNATNVICNGGNDGTATAEGIGGVEPYTYQWSANAGGQTTATATNLVEGSYVVSIFDANGCGASATINIEEPIELKITDFTARDVECFGENTGTLTADVEGGNAPYTYTWSNGETTESVENLLAGTYNLTVTDLNGCTTGNAAIIRQPSEALTATSDVDDVSCFGGFDGQLHLFPSGGTPPYTYSSDGIDFNGSPTQIGIYAGTYTKVIVRDARGCLLQLPPMVVGEPSAIEVDLGRDTTILYGESIQLFPTVLNAAGATSFEWTPSANPYLSCNNCPPPVSVDSLDSQTSYKVVVTDENGCTGSDIITIFVKKFREVAVPTGFSPNGDAANNLLLVHGRDGSIITMFRVFDRWGEMVYENRNFMINDETQGWDGTHRGKEMNPGVYVWYMEVLFEDGATELFKGETTLVR